MQLGRNGVKFISSIRVGLGTAFRKTREGLLPPSMLGRAFILKMKMWGTANFLKPLEMVWHMVKVVDAVEPQI